MGTDILDLFLSQVGPHVDGACQFSGKSTSTFTASNEKLHLGDLYRSDVSISRVDRDLACLEEVPVDFSAFDAFGGDDDAFDIPMCHEFILTQAPEQVPQLLSDVSSQFSDYFQCSANNWKYGPDCSDDAVPVAVAAIAEIDPFAFDSDVKSSAVCDFSTTDDDQFLEQLHRLLQQDCVPQNANEVSDCDMTEERPCSTGSASQYSTEFSATPTPESPHSLVGVEEVMVAGIKPTAPKMGILLPSGPLPPQQTAKRQLKSIPSVAPTATKSRRPYSRRCPLPSPSPSLASSGSSKKSNKVTPKKRTQNRKAAGDYRNRKRMEEEGKMQEHENLLKLRDSLRDQHTTLMQELKFALKMAEAKLKRLS